MFGIFQQTREGLVWLGNELTKEDCAIVMRDQLQMDGVEFIMAIPLAAFGDAESGDQIELF